MSRFERAQLLIGDAGLCKLAGARVLVAGLGGVGAFAAELLCRAGVGGITVADGDVIEESNLNRQLPALISTLGKSKAEVVGNRLLDINPELELKIFAHYLRDELTVNLIESQRYDYVVDCIDSLSPKVFLIYHSVRKGLKVVSSMGSGGKMDPLQVTVKDISETLGCNLARMVRKRLRRLGVFEGVKAVYSPEQVPTHAVMPPRETGSHSVVGSVSYMPAVFGCIIAGVVVRDLLKITG